MVDRTVNRLRIEVLCFGKVEIAETPEHTNIIKSINETPEAKLLDCWAELQVGLKGEWYTVVSYDVTFMSEDEEEQSCRADELWEALLANGVDDSVSTSWIVPHKGLHQITY